VRFLRPVLLALAAARVNRGAQRARLRIAREIWAYLIAHVADRKAGVRIGVSE